MGVVCDLTILIEGYVEIYTYDCLLTGKVEFVDCHNCIIINNVKNVVVTAYKVTTF